MLTTRDFNTLNYQKVTYEILAAEVFNLIEDRYWLSRSTHLVLDYLNSAEISVNPHTIGFFPMGELAETHASRVDKYRTRGKPSQSILNRVYLDFHKKSSSVKKAQIKHPHNITEKIHSIVLTHQSRQEEFLKLIDGISTSEIRILNYLRCINYKTASNNFNSDKVMKIANTVQKTRKQIKYIVIETRPMDFSPFWSNETTIFQPSNTILVFFSDVIPSERTSQNTKNYISHCSGLSLDFIDKLINAHPQANIHLAIDSPFSLLFLWLVQKHSERIITTECYDLSIEMPFIKDNFCYWYPFNQNDPIRYSLNVISEYLILSNKTNIISKRFGNPWQKIFKSFGKKENSFYCYFKVGETLRKNQTLKAKSSSNKQIRFIFASSLLPITELASENILNWHVHGILSYLTYIHEETDHHLSIYNAAHHNSSNDDDFKFYLNKFHSRTGKTVYYRKVGNCQLLRNAQTYDFHFSASAFKPIYSSYNAPQRIVNLLPIGLPSIFTRGHFSESFESLVERYNAGIILNPIDNFTPYQNSLNFRYDTLCRQMGDNFIVVENAMKDAEKMRKGALDLTAFMRQNNLEIKNKLFL